MESIHSSEIELLKDTNRDLRYSFDQLSALQGLSSKISVSKSHKDIIQSVIEVIPQIIACHSCQIYLFENEKFRKIGGSLFNSEEVFQPADQETMYWCCKRASVSVQPGETEDTGSAIAPLVQGEEIIGAIVLDLGNYYTSYSEVTGLSLTTIANHTALAISNYNSHNQLEEKAVVLKDVKEYISSVLASISHSLISVDPDGRVKVFNRKAEEFFEIRSRIVIGQPYSVVFPDYLTRVFDELMRSLQKGNSPEPYELSFTTRYAKEKNTLITATPLNLSGTSKKGMVCVCQDLALSKEVERLQELDKMKDDFISMVSHELKTPLASILAYSETLLDGLAENKEEETQFLQVIFDEGNRLGQLVNDILDLAKIESGKMNFTLHPFLPGDLIEKGVTSAKTLCMKKDQKLVVDLEENLPAVNGDFEKMTQVIINLVSNAIKFTPEKGVITLGALIEDPSHKNTVVKFFVRDNGIGINKADLPKVFDKFSQIEDVMHHSEGTGLGMPISREILRAHGSDLHLESEPSIGTEFVFFMSPST